MWFKYNPLVVRRPTTPDSPTPPYGIGFAFDHAQSLRSKSGSLAMFDAMRLALIAGAKSAQNQTTPIEIAKHRCSAGTTHGCRWGRTCYDHCGLRHHRRSDCIGGMGRSD